MVHVLRNDHEPNWHSFSPITSYDHAGYIWVAALYCIIFSSLVLITRIWIKRFSWGPDDTVFAAATIAQVGHVVAIFVALKNGLGRVPEPRLLHDTRNAVFNTSRYETGGKAAFAATILLIVALTLTKVSLLLFMRRLMTSQSRRVLLLSYVLIAISALWGLASIISTGIDCSPGGFITDGSAKDCRDTGRKWAGIATVDALTEFVIMAIPIAIVWPLKMSTELKFQAFSAFLFRLGVAAAAIVHAVYVAKYEHSQHPSIAMVPAVVAAEAELCWSLVSAAIPNLKNFMKSFATGFGHEFGLGVTAWADRARVPPRTKDKKVGSSIPLKHISRKIWHAERPGDFVSDPQTSGYATEVSTARNGDTQSHRSGASGEFMIRKQVTMSVGHESELRERT